MMVREAKAKAVFLNDRLIAEKHKVSLELYDKSRYGEVVGDKIHYSMFEGLYLLEKKKLNIKDSKAKAIKFDKYIAKAIRKDKEFLTKYYVFKDMRDRGYIVKTALKFGAEFRVYDRGIKPGDDHAKWILYPVHERDTLTWHGFSAKNRVAHSTRKTLLIGVVDEETDVTYYNVAWLRP